MSSFKYLICMDLEAHRGAEDNSMENAEIIKIGAVLLNVGDGTIESRFESYVRPRLSFDPRYRSAFYRFNSTGAAQWQIAYNETFPIVYAKFVRWIEGIQSERELRFASPTERNAVENGPNATFCTWDVKNLNHFFKIECHRTEINIPSYFKTWINARSLFSEIYPSEFVFKFTDWKNIDYSHSNSEITEATHLGTLVADLIGHGVQCNRTTGYY